VQEIQEKEKQPMKKELEKEIVLKLKEKLSAESRRNQISKIHTKTKEKERKSMEFTAGRKRNEERKNQS